MKTWVAFAGGRVLTTLSSLYLASAAGAVAWGGHSTARSGLELGVAGCRGGAELLAFREIRSDRAVLDAEMASKIARSAAWLMVMWSVAALCYYGLIGTLKRNELSFLVVAASAPVMCASQSLTSIIAAAGKTATVFLEQLWFPIARVSLAATLFMIMPNKMDVLAFSLLGASVIVLVRTYAVAARFAGKPLDILAWPPASRAELFEIISLGTNVLLGGILSRLDVMIVGTCLGFRAAGTYALISTGASLVSISTGAIGRVVGPEVRAFVRQGDTDRLPQLLHRFQRLGLCGGLAVGSAVQFALAVGLPLVHYSWTMSTSVAAALLCASFILLGALGVTGYALSLSGRQALERKLLLLYAGTFAVAATLGAYTIAVVGVALASFGATVLLLVTRTVVVRRVFNISISVTGGLGWGRAISAIGLSLSPAAGLLASGLKADIKYDAALFVISCLVTPLAVLIASTQSDRREAVNLLRRWRLEGAARRNAL